MKKKMNLPNKLTILRMIIVLVIILLALLPEGNSFGFWELSYDYRMISILVLFAIGSYTDHLDGHIARKNNIVTTFGKFMDPIADKLLVNSLFIILTGMGKIHWLVTVIMVGRDIIVDVIRLIMVERGTVIAASKLGKLKTVAQMIAIICVLALPTPDGYCLNICTDVLTYIAAFISLISGFDYFWKNKHYQLRLCTRMESHRVPSSPLQQ